MSKIKSILRPLSQIEESFMRTSLFYPLNAVCVIELFQNPAPEALRSALDRLRTVNPFLQVAIKEADNRFFFVQDAGGRKIPLTMIPRSGDDHWQEIVKAELNREFDHTQSPLMAASYLNSADPSGNSEIILSFHHAFADSFSFLAMLEQLLSRMGIVDGSYQDDNVTQESHDPVSPLLSEVIPPGFRGGRLFFRLVPFLLRQMRDEIRYRRASRAVPDKPVPGSSENGLMTVRFSENETTALIKWSRKNRLTLKSLITSAMLTALNTTRYQGRKSLMRAVQFANLRPYLVPPLPGSVPGSYVALTRFCVPVSDGNNIASAAAWLDRKMAASFKRGDKFLYAMVVNQLAKRVIRTRSARMGSAALSYAGAIPLSETYGNLRIRDFHAFITNNAIGAELPAFGKIFSGRLSLDLNCLTAETTPSEAEEMARIIKSSLLKISLGDG